MIQTCSASRWEMYRKLNKPAKWANCLGRFLKMRRNRRCVRELSIETNSEKNVGVDCLKNGLAQIRF